MKDKRIVISPPERRELERRVRSRTIGAEDARRAQVILALGSGLGVRAVASKLKCIIRISSAGESAFWQAV